MTKYALKVKDSAKYVFSTKTPKNKREITYFLNFTLNYWKTPIKILS